MANLFNFSITPLANSNPGPIPRFSVAAEVRADDGTVLADFTGANALVFPAVLTQLTALQRRRLVHLIAHYLVQARAGMTEA